MSKTECFRQTRQSCLKDWKKENKSDMTRNPEECEILEWDMGQTS